MSINYLEEQNYKIQFCKCVTVVRNEMIFSFFGETFDGWARGWLNDVVKFSLLFFFHVFFGPSAAVFISLQPIVGLVFEGYETGEKGRSELGFPCMGDAITFRILNT